MALKLIDEKIINDVLDKIESNKREHPHTKELDGIHQIFVNIKSHLRPLPDSSDQEQDALWNEVYSTTKDYFPLSHMKLVKELKKQFTIQKK